jgi:glyoxylase-like metal-dependent hydrolase (beta-lactamase superfamily II)
VREIAPGLHHGTAFHEGIGADVSSYYVDSAHAMIDPMVPAEGIGWFADRDPQVILLTNRHHYRGSDEFREAFGCPVLCHEAGLHEFEDGPDVEGFGFGDRMAPGITALELGAICPEETALRIEVGNGFLAFADGLINYGELRFVPDQLLGDDPEGVKRGLRASLRRLLDEDFDGLLFAHGEPVVSGGKGALAHFVESE